MTKKEPFRIKINDVYTFEAQPDELEQFDALQEAEPSRWHVIREGKAWKVEVETSDPARRVYRLRINGVVYEAHIADYYERLIQQLGLKSGTGAKSDAVKAPMPGLALNILVQPGQRVQKGDPLLILEAMKMENVIKAAADATVGEVKVSVGDAVEKGHVLITFQPEP